MDQKTPFTDESFQLNNEYQDDYGILPSANNECNRYEGSNRWLEYIHNKKDVKRSQPVGGHRIRCSACSSIYNPIDFGSHYFPRYIQSAVCSERESRCPVGTVCAPVAYQVLLLTFRAENDIPFYQEQRIPEPLRNLMKYESKIVNATCQCLELRTSADNV